MNRTILFDRHVELGAKMVEFGGWEMPVQYPTGILEEHLATRRRAGLFDICHMGRFTLRGEDALPLLQHVLTNNAAGLEVGRAQYTMIPDPDGGAIDDAYLYRFFAEEYLLVVNAANREKDWRHLEEQRRAFPRLELADRTGEIAMLSLQGPRSRQILLAVLDGAGRSQGGRRAAEARDGGSGRSQAAGPHQGRGRDAAGRLRLRVAEELLPQPRRNRLAAAAIAGRPVWIGRTGYTGEPLGFELFLPREQSAGVWDRLRQEGAAPVGLGARDSLRLEAGLPLYGHELGRDPEGNEIPVFACPLARFAVSLSPLKGDFIGRAPLARQQDAFRRLAQGDPSGHADLPRWIRPLALLDKGVARAGDPLFREGQQAGWVTSGTVAPYWKSEGEGLASRLTGQSGRRSIGLALVDSRLAEGVELEVEIRGRRVPARLVAHHLRSEAPPYARAVVYGPETKGGEAEAAGDTDVDVPPKPGRAEAAPPAPPAAASPGEVPPAVLHLLRQAADNTRWRQGECINLIPSEQTQSPLVRLLSVMDPVHRYGEHQRMRALANAEVFYYQGTDFIREVERRVEREMASYLGCREVEARPVSGQMANMVVFGALVDCRNRGDRRCEPRRLQSVLNYHILQGGHLSAQPMGALRDFVARDPLTERAAVVHFPVLPEDPYRMDVPRVRELVERHRPSLVILGRSMTLYREPVAEIRTFLDELSPDTLLMYDMAHVLGLVGPHFQQPFREGADVVTGSTHKTFFGPQRGVVGADLSEGDAKYPFWEAVRRRAFPGSVSNHHLGTLLGLLMAAYEMNHFKADYQPRVLANARALARALNEEGLAVAGDPGRGFTETHQVIVQVGYGQGVEAARNLERNNIITNYQATPREEGFTASGALRLGVAEMTRFGMQEEDFRAVARFIREVVRDSREVGKEVARFRRRFGELRYCFTGRQIEERLAELHALL
jgi:aminomethyltransferase